MMGQIGVFATKASDEFVQRMIDYVRDNFPRKFMTFGAEVTRRHVEAAIDEAKEFHFETERQIAAYIDLGLRFGRVSQAEWAQANLKPESGPPEQRMRGLQQAALKIHGRAS